jgi:hypothetical protein
MRLDIEEKRRDHADRFLPGNVALVSKKKKSHFKVLE